MPRPWGQRGGGRLLTPPPRPQDPRHLQYFADLTESNIYYVTQGKKHYGTPTEFGFCIKVRPLWAPQPALPKGLCPPRGDRDTGRGQGGLPCDGSVLSPQPYKVRSGTKGLKLLCSEDEQSRTCWMAAFRLFKVSPGPPRRVLGVPVAGVWSVMGSGGC